MRNLLLTLVALFMVNTAMADNYLYLDEVSIPSSERQITVPVKAHFDGRLNVFQLDLVYPEGLTPVGFENGEGLNVAYYNETGHRQIEHVNMTANNGYTRFMAVIWNQGYWQPEGSGSYECYGSVKWEAGDYDEMFLLTLEADEYFYEGVISMTTQVTSTATEYGELLTMTTECPVHIMYEPEQTPMPTIIWEADNNYVTVMAEGEGDVHLYIDGEEVDNPFMIERSYDQDIEFDATATAQLNGQLISETAYEHIYVEAIPKMDVPAPVITCNMEDDRATVYVEWPESDGDRVLIVNGEWYDPYMMPIEFMRYEVTQDYVIEAYTTEGPTFNESYHTSYAFTIPGWDYVPVPVIEVQVNDDAVVVTATGEGDVLLYIDGEEVENPYSLPREENEYYVEAMATAHVDGMLDTSYTTIVTVPAKETGPTPPEPTGYSLTMADAETLHGKTIVIPVTMTNVEEVTAFQTDLYLPEGFELLDVVLSNRKSDHQLQRSNRPDGSVRILCYSMMLTPFAGHDGELFYITVKVPDNAVGEYNLMLKKSLLTLAANCDEVRCDDATNTVNVWAYVIGDANGDGEVTVTDIVVTAKYILGEDVDTFIFEAADVNGDGDITVTDVVLIARMVLDPELVGPGRAPALGANDDSMSADDIQLEVGETRTVSIALDNAIAYTAFQLDLQLPDGLSADNFRLTSRAGSHVLGSNMQADGTQRVMCYSPMLAVIDGQDGALLTFDVTATSQVTGEINVDGIELVSAACQTVYLNAFNIGVTSSGATALDEINGGLRIYADGHDIIVESPVDQRVIISDVAGHSYSVDVTAGRNVIPARVSGVVVVAAGEKTVKLMLN